MSHPTRRRFLRGSLGLGATLGLGAWQAAPSTGAVPSGPPLDLTGMPYRQDDPRWAADLLWERDLVIRADTTLNGHSRAEAEELLHDYPDGNSIGNEGCMLTCLAMVLRLLGPQRTPAWTPGSLNRAAQDAHYYTRSGLSMTTLYPDLVAELSEGAVQLGISEDYLPGVPGWRRLHAHTAPLVRAYRGLTPSRRRDILVMVKTGTYDDSVASHYALLHPSVTESPDDRDAAILDPAMPSTPPQRDRPWRLTDSARWITQDPEIAAAWRADAITPTQLGGAWVFARWDRARGATTLRPLLQAWARELTA